MKLKKSPLTLRFVSKKSKLIRNKSMKYSALFLLLCAFSGQAYVNADVNKTTIYNGDTLRFVIESDESGAPDLSPLADFEIVQRGQSHQTQCINGKCEQKTQWSFVLRPRQSSAQLTIPAISVGNSATQPIQITQLQEQNPAAQIQNQPESKIQVRYDIAEKTLFVNQTDLMYLHILIPESIARSIQNVDLELPKIQNADIERLNVPVKEELVIEQGRRFLQLRIPFRLTAIQSGELTLPPAYFKVEGNRNYTPFSENIPSEAVVLNIAPKPQDYPKDAPFYPAKEIDLERTWSTQDHTIKEGESFSQRVILAAEGLTTAQLNAPLLPEIENVKTYLGEKKQAESWIEHHSIYGMIEVNTTFVATKTGEITIPEIKIPWWNVKTNQLEYAIAPAQTFFVEPNAALTHAETQMPEAQPEELQNAFAANALKWILGAAILCLLFLWLLFLARRKRKTPRAVNIDSFVAPEKPLTEPALKQQLKRACRENNAQKAKEALQLLAQQQAFDLDKALKNVDFKQAYEALNQILYRDPASNWQGSALWKAFDALDRPVSKAKKSSDLPPIYPD